MLKQKYFLTGIFILSAERQPIKLSWRKIVWLQLVIADLRDIESCMKKTLELYDRSNNNNEILIHLNQLHILIQRFQRTIDIDGMDMRALQDAFWRLFAAATDYDSGYDTDSIDIPSVQRYGDDLIIEVRRIIRVINTK